MVYEKLFKLQGEFSPLSKDKENPFFKSKYVDINAIYDMIKPIFQENKLLLMQNPVESDGNKINIKTIIYDIEDNSKIESVISLPYGASDPQKAGSAITYAKRYALVSILCLQAHDDDGNRTITVSASQISQLKKADIKNILPAMLKQKGLRSNNDIPAGSFDGFLTYINNSNKE